MMQSTVQRIVRGVLTGLFAVGILGVAQAHEGDLHQLLTQGRPQPFVGGGSL